jgi:hypothetical protein
MATSALSVPFGDESPMLPSELNRSARLLRVAYYRWGIEDFERLVLNQSW